MYKMEHQSPIQNIYMGSPSDIEKKRLLQLSFECTDHRAKAYQDDAEKYAFSTKTEDLMFRLMRFTPKVQRDVLEAHYNEVQEKMDKVDNSKLDPASKERSKVALMFEYAEHVHIQNMRLIPNTTIMEQKVEGEMDIADKDAINIIRGGKREDTTAKIRR